MKLRKSLLVSGLLVVLLTGYQNCGMHSSIFMQEQQAAQSTSPSTSSTPNPSPSPVVSPSPSPAPAPAPSPMPAPSPASTSTRKYVYVPINSTYKLTFDEEFNGTTLDASKWTGGWFANAQGISQPVNSDEACAYDNKNISFDGSSMIFSSAYKSVTVNGKSYSCTSASIDSFGKFSQAYGYVEARIWVQGSSNGTIYNWPAFWMVGSNPPSTGELDVLEGLDGGHAEYHFHSSSGGPGGTAQGNYVGWHIFAALWAPGAATFYYDGAQVGKITQGITSAPQSFVITQAMGGIGGPLTVPSQMKIDYVHMYSNSPSAVAITPQAGYNGPGDAGL